LKIGLDFRQGIEPGNQWPPFLGVIQPAVDLLLNGLGEASDFTFGGFIHIFLWPEKGGYGRM